MEDGTDSTVQSNTNPPSGQLVQVTFVKDQNRKAKYLESEPKALGCTQILLGIFLINFGVIDDSFWIGKAEVVNGVFPIIAGGVAIAARNLSLPMLKTCLALQVFSTITCVITFLTTTSVRLDMRHYYCGYRISPNDTKSIQLCSMLWHAEEHYFAVSKLVLATVIAISATLAAYCCKVIQCCSPQSLTPVITVNAPLTPVSREDAEGESPGNE